MHQAICKYITLSLVIKMIYALNSLGRGERTALDMQFRNLSLRVSLKSPFLLQNVGIKYIHYCLLQTGPRLLPRRCLVACRKYQIGWVITLLFICSRGLPGFGSILLITVCRVLLICFYFFSACMSFLAFLSRSLFLYFIGFSAPYFIIIGKMDTNIFLLH